MNVSFDRMRKKATGDMNCLFYEISKIVTMDKDELEYYDLSYLKATFNDASLSVDMFNCLRDKDGKYDSLDIKIHRFNEVE